MLRGKRLASGVLVVLLGGAGAAAGVSVGAPPSVAPLPGSPLTSGTSTNTATGPIAIAPLDANSRADVVVRRPNSDLSTYLAPPDPLSQPFALGSTFSTGSTVDELNASDLDADGDVDLAVFNGSTYRTMLNNGAATFAAQPSSVVTPGPGSGYAVGRLNTDPYPDLVYAASGSRAYRFGSASGSFGGGGSFSALVTSDQAIGDVDGDGDGDVVALNKQTTPKTVNVARNDGGGVFTDLAPAATAGQPVAVRIADLDGDGNGEIVALATGPNALVVHATGVTGAPQPPTSTPSGLTSANVSPAALEIADIDGDDRLDAVVADANSTDLRALLGGSGTSFGASQALGAPAIFQFNDVAVADLTGDGRADFAVSSRGGQRIDLLRNTTPWPPRANTTAASATGPTTGRASGTADPRGVAGTVSFEYGTTTAYGSATEQVPLAAAGGSRVVQADLAGLAPATLHHVRLVVSTADGTARGADRTFTTNAAAPGATTNAQPPPPGGPTAVLVPPGTLIPPGVEVPFDASSSVGDGLRFRWDVDGDGSFKIDTGTDPVLRRSFDASGPHRVRVLVADRSGRTAQAEATVTVPSRDGLRLETKAFGVPVDKPVKVQTKRVGASAAALKQASGRAVAGFDQYQIGRVNSGRDTVALPGGGPRLSLLGEVAPAGQPTTVEYPKSGDFALTADAGALSGVESLRFVAGIVAGRGDGQSPNGRAAAIKLKSLQSSATYQSSATTAQESAWTVGFTYDGDPELGQNRSFNDTSKFVKQGDSLVYGASSDRPHTLVYDWGDGTPNTVSTNGASVQHKWFKARTYQVKVTLFDPALSKVVPRGTITLPVTVSRDNAICTKFVNAKDVVISPLVGSCLYKPSAGSSAYVLTPGGSVFVNGVRLTGTGLVFLNDRTKVVGTGMALETVFGRLAVPKGLPLSLTQLTPHEIPPTVMGAIKLGTTSLRFGASSTGPRLRGVTTIPPPVFGSVINTYALRTGQVTTQRNDGAGAGGAGGGSVSLSFLDFANISVTNHADGATSIGGKASFGPYSLDATDSYPVRRTPPGGSFEAPSGIWIGPGSDFTAGAVLQAPIPIFPGVEVNNLGVAFQKGPIDSLQGSATVQTTGDVLGRRLIKIDGCFVAYKAEDSTPNGTAAPKCRQEILFPITLTPVRRAGVRVAGVATVMGIQVGDVGLGVYPDQIAIEAQLNTEVIPFGILLIKLRAGFVVATDLSRFHAQFKAEACTEFIVDDCFGGADFVLSSRGVGACINTPAALPSPGFWLRWNQELTFRRIYKQSMFYGCRVQDINKEVGAARAAGTALRAVLEQDAPAVSPFGATAAPVPVEVPDATRQTALIATGVGAPPRFLVKDPAGKVVLNPDTPPASGRRPSFVSVEQAQETAAMLVDAPAGRYSIEPLPGSPAITGVRVQQTIPTSSVRGRVIRRPGGKFALEYVAPKLPGQEILLQEFEGQRELGFLPTLGKGKGRLAFKPGFGKGGTRRIVARVLQEGRPIDSFTLATYTAPPPRAIQTVKRLRVTRSKTALLVRWVPAAGAKRYRVRVQSTDGQRLTVQVRGRAGRVSIPTVGSGAGARVTVVTEGEKGRVSKPAKASLKAGKRPRPKPVKV